jgi:hypothetical protein
MNFTSILLSTARAAASTQDTALSRCLVLPALPLQLCFPALLAAHTILMGYDIALLHICSRPVHLMLPQVLLFRLCAVAFGTGVDLVRRCVFLQHHQQNNQQLLSQKKVA